jgi:cytochrome c biogenesis protein CcdA
MDPSSVPLDVPIDEKVFGGAALLIVGFWIVFVILFVCAIGFILYTATRRYRAAKRAGLDPFAGDIQVMGRVNDAALLAPASTVAQRLSEVDALHSAGSISDDELAQARARILGTA